MSIQLRKIMGKPSESRAKGLFKRIFKVRSWLDLDRIQSGKSYIADQAETWFVPGKEQKIESFDEAKTRLNLSDQDILVRQKGLLRLSIIMVGAAMAVFSYTVYNLIYHYYAAALVSVVLTMLALVMAFRYHFWYFQIKHQKLGCSVREWFTQGIMGAKDE